jgi:hypothetical protein
MSLSMLFSVLILAPMAASWKAVVSLLKPFSGLAAQVLSGGSCQRYMLIGTAFTNDLPVGVTTVFGERCISILSTILIWKT